MAALNPTVKKGFIPGCVFVLVATLGTVALVWIALRRISLPAAASPTPTLDATARVAPPAATPTPNPHGKWHIQKDTSRVDDSATVNLWLEADSEVTGWMKTSTPILYVRCQGHRTQVFVHTGMAPAVEYDDGATVIVRLDKQPAARLQASKSSDDEALFMPDPILSARQMVKSQLFKFTPFNASPQETTFTLTGLVGLIGEVQAACGWK